MKKAVHKSHDDFSLVMHRRIAAHLARHPEDLKITLENLNRWSKTTSGHAMPYLKACDQSYLAEKVRLSKQCSPKQKDLTSFVIALLSSEFCLNKKSEKLV